MRRNIIIAAVIAATADIAIRATVTSTDIAIRDTATIAAIEIHAVTAATGIPNIMADTAIARSRWDSAAMDMAATLINMGTTMPTMAETPMVAARLTFAGA